jgi:UPF0716 protein FxsA
VRLLPLAALLLFLAEVVAFIGLGELIGYPVAVLAVVGLSLLGLVLLRREGLRAWRGFRRAETSGEPPGPQVTDGLIGLGGALLLAVPGLLTGLGGLVLLAPPVRQLARERTRARIERRLSSGEAGVMFGPRRVRVVQDDPGAPGATDEDVVEGEVVDPPRGRETG